MHPWEWLDCPWTRIHIEYAGPVKGKMILVFVDSHSKSHVTVYLQDPMNATSTVGRPHQTNRLYTNFRAITQAYIAILAVNWPMHWTSDFQIYSLTNYCSLEIELANTVVKTPIKIRNLCKIFINILKAKEKI